MISYNIKFPIVDDNKNNSYFLSNQVTKDALTSDLLLLLLTQQGERYYESDYGCDLLQYIFEPNDSQTSSDVEASIKTMVSKYIPSLTVNSVTFFQETDENGFTIPDSQLDVKVLFTYSEDVFSEQGQLNLTF